MQRRTQRQSGMTSVGAEQVPSAAPGASSSVHAQVVRIGRCYVAAAVLTAAVLCAHAWGKAAPSLAVRAGAWDVYADRSADSLLASLSAEQQPLELPPEAYPAWAESSSAESSGAGNNATTGAWVASFEGFDAVPPPPPSEQQQAPAAPPLPAAAVGAPVEAAGGTLERLVTASGDAVELVWQAPAAGRNASGALLLAHDCSHSATDWWPPSPGCPACAGLPEETRVVGAARAAGYFVVAASSVDRDSKCWHISGAGTPSCACALRHATPALPLLA